MEDVKSLLGNLKYTIWPIPTRTSILLSLTDFADAAEKERPEDAPLLAAALEGISALNQRYPHPKGRSYFHLLHRERRFNPQGRGLDGLGTETREAYRIQRLTRRRKKRPVIRRSPAIANFINRSVT